MSNLIKERLQVVNASAGSGKTTQLVSRLIGILGSNGDPTRVCATTFTRKAAYEINSRLFLTIARVITKDLNSIIPVDVARTILRSMTVGGQSPRVATIDSFFSEAVRCFSNEMGLPPEWQIVSEAEGDETLSNLCDDIIQGSDGKKVGALLRILKDDRNFREFREDLVSEVKAGLSLWRQVPREDRISVWMWHNDSIASQYNFQQIIRELSLVQLPSGKGGAEVDSRYQDTLEDLLALLEQNNARRVVKNGLVKAIIEGKNTYYKKEIGTPLLNLLKELVSLLRAEISQQTYYKSLAFYELLSLFDSLYLERIRQSGNLSYDDLKMLIDSDLGDNFLDLLSIRLDSRFDHFLFDEFQDTSLVQWRFFERFVEEIITDQEGGRTLFIVGDKKQSIYGWRGGVRELFDLVSNQIKDFGGLVESTAKNFRSSPAVISVVNQVFKNLLRAELSLEHRAQAENWLKDYKTHEAYNADLPGEVKIFNFREVDRVKNVVELVQNLLTNPSIKEIGVLVQTNKELRHLARCFDDVGIVVSEEGGAPLEIEPLCIAFSNLLHLVDHPGDTSASLIVSSSIIGEVVGLRDFSDPLERIQVSRRIRQKIQELGAFSALSSELAPLRPRITPREVSILDEILELVLTKESDGNLRISKLIPVIRKHKLERAIYGRVRLLTTHSAKGLEFDVVILTELSRAIFSRSGPLYLVDQPNELEPPDRILKSEKAEIRALFPDLERIYQQQRSKRFEGALSVLYVSLTRAKRGLALIFDLDKKRLEQSFQTMLTEILQVEAPDLQTGKTIAGREGEIFS